MEKINQVVDMIEHPEKYSEAQMNDIFQDEEFRQTYLTMMEIRMAYDKKNVDDNLDLDQEWKRFEQSHECEAGQSHLKYSETSKRSLSSWRKMAASFVGILLLSSVAFAAIHTYFPRYDKPYVATSADRENVKRAACVDSLSQQHPKKSIGEQNKNFRKTFDNVVLSGMLAEMAKYYGVEVEYHNIEAKQLRFYYEWNSGDELQKVLEELNHSQQVSLSLENGTIVVE